MPCHVCTCATSLLVLESLLPQLQYTAGHMHQGCCRGAAISVLGLTISMQQCSISLVGCHLWANCVGGWVCHCECCVGVCVCMCLGVWLAGARQQWSTCSLSSPPCNVLCGGLCCCVACVPVTPPTHPPYNSVEAGLIQCHHCVLCIPCKAGGVLGPNLGVVLTAARQPQEEGCC